MAKLVTLCFKPFGSTENISDVPSTPSSRGGGQDVRKTVAFVELLKHTNEPLGLALDGGNNRDVQVHVSALRPGGVAEKSGALQVGDRILSINGTATDRLTHNEVNALLRNCGNVINLEIEFDSPNGDVDDSTVKKRATIKLQREDPSSYGFTISGGRNENRPITVSNVTVTSSVYRHGILKAGDRIIKVNGEDVSHASQMEVHSLLKTVEGTCMLEIEYDVTVHEGLAEATSALLIELLKPKGVSLGLGLSESVVPGAPLWISRIKEAGIADRCGALHVGDRILSIGGVSLENKNIQEVNQMLKKCDLHVQLEIIPGHNYPNEEELLSERMSRLSHVPRDMSTSQLSGAQSQLSLASTATSTGHLVSHPERMTVTLKADDYGFGLSLQGGATDRINYPLVIASIEDLGPAAKLGQLQVGDQILAINGVGMEGVTLQQAVKLVQEANDVIDLEVMYNVNDAIVPTSGIFDVRMQRTSTLTLGITINGSHRQGDTIWISNLKKGGIASRMGMLQSGDVLLAVNGESLENATLRDAAKMLRNAGDVVTLTVSKESVPVARKPETIIFSVELHRNNQSLGITMTGSRDKGGCPTISKIKEDGVAHKTGTLRVGDKILAINGESLFNKTVPEAVRILHAAGDVVTLKISKSTRRTRSRPKASSPTGKGRHKDFSAFHRDMMSRNRMGSRASSINGYNRFNNRMPRFSQDSLSGRSTPDNHPFDRYGATGGGMLSQEVPGEHDDIMERLTPSEAESEFSRLPPPPSTISQSSHYNRVLSYVQDHQLLMAPSRSPPSSSSGGAYPPPQLLNSPTHPPGPAAAMPVPPSLRSNPYSAPQLLPRPYHPPGAGRMNMHTPTSSIAEEGGGGRGGGATAAMSELEEEELAALERRRDGGVGGYRRASLPTSSNTAALTASSYSPEGKKWDFKYPRSRRAYKQRAAGPNGNGYGARGRMSPYASSDMSRFTSHSPFPNHLEESPTDPIKKLATPTTPPTSSAAMGSLGRPTRSKRSSSRSPVKPSSPVSMETPLSHHPYHLQHDHTHNHIPDHTYYSRQHSLESPPVDFSGSKVIHVQNSYEEEDDPDNGAKAASGGSRCGSKMSSSQGSRSDYENDDRMMSSSSYRPPGKDLARDDGGYSRTSFQPSLGGGGGVSTSSRSSLRLDLNSMHEPQPPPYEPRQERQEADDCRLTQSLVLGRGGDKSNGIGRTTVDEDGTHLRAYSFTSLGGHMTKSHMTTGYMTTGHMTAALPSSHTRGSPPYDHNSMSTEDHFNTSVGEYCVPKLDLAKADTDDVTPEKDVSSAGCDSVDSGLPKQKSSSSLRSNSSTATLQSKSGSDINRSVNVSSTSSAATTRGVVVTTSTISSVGGESPTHRAAPLSTYSESTIKSTVESLNGFKQSIDRAITFEQQLKALAESGSSDQDSDSEPHASQGLAIPPHEQEKISEKMKTSLPPQQLTVRLTKPPTMASFGFSVADGQYDQGVYVKAVKPGGPADGSEGLRSYDRILKVNNREITSEVNCKTILPLFKGGDELTLMVARSLTSGAEPFK